MAHSHRKECPNCGAVIYIQEMPMGVPGGKDTEEAYCPICGTLLYTAMTDGWFEKSVVSPPTKAPYKKEDNNVK